MVRAQNGQLESMGYKTNSATKYLYYLKLVITLFEPPFLKICDTRGLDLIDPGSY